MSFAVSLVFVTSFVQVSYKFRTSFAIPRARRTFAADDHVFQREVTIPGKMLCCVCCCCQPWPPHSERRASRVGARRFVFVLRAGAWRLRTGHTRQATHRVAQGECAGDDAWRPVSLPLCSEKIRRGEKMRSCKFCALAIVSVRSGCRRAGHHR